MIDRRKKKVAIILCALLYAYIACTKCSPCLQLKSSGARSFFLLLPGVLPGSADPGTHPFVFLRQAILHHKTPFACRSCEVQYACNAAII